MDNQGLRNQAIKIESGAMLQLAISGQRDKTSKTEKKNPEKKKEFSWKAAAKTHTAYSQLETEV